MTGQAGRLAVMEDDTVLCTDCLDDYQDEGLPEIAVQPARYRTISRRDPVTGKRVAHQAFVRAAIRVPVCGEHQHITRGQPPPVPVPRQRTARNVEQLGMFAATPDERLRNAIYRETDR